MPNRPNFPIPDEIHPPMQCIQLCIPNEPTYKSVFAGLIYELTYWYNWQRTDDDSGAQCANVWKEIYNSIDWSIMSCCPEETIPLARWTSDGHYQTSEDGGVTWQESESRDPRRPITEFPPFLPPDTLDEKCNYADSVVQVIKTQMVDVMVDGQNKEQIINIIVTALFGVMAALSPSVIGSIIVAVMGGIVLLIVAGSIPAFQAAMTSGVYDRFRCNLVTHIGNDGQFSQSQVDAVYSQLASDETGLALLFLQGVVAAAGWQGLTNMARAGMGNASADCNSCYDCEANWIIGNLGFPTFGTLLSRSGNDYTFQSQASGGVNYLTLMTDDETMCCSVISMVAAPGSSMPSAGYVADRIVCPNTQVAGNISNGSILSSVGQLNFIGFNSSTPFTVIITFG